MPLILGAKTVGPLGLDLLALRQGPTRPDAQVFDAMRAAIRCGTTLWTTEAGPGDDSLQLLERYFATFPDDSSKVFLCIKAHAGSGVGTGPETRHPPAAIRASVEKSVNVLRGTKAIDVFIYACVEDGVPLEEAVATLAQLRREGLIKAVGLGNVTADAVHRAAAVTPLAMVQADLSLWTDDILRNGVLEACRNLGIPVAAYNPTGRDSSDSSFCPGSLERLNDIIAEQIVSPLQDAALLREKVHALAAENQGVRALQWSLGWVASFSRPGTPVIPVLGFGPEGWLKKKSCADRVCVQSLGQRSEAMAHFQQRLHPFVRHLFKDC